MTTDNHLAAPSFDRMRNMLVRAAEVRESEQQQIFDALDDIYARLAPVDSLGAVRKRLSELPDRTEVSVLAERLDEAMTRLEAQDNALADLARAVESIVDKLAKPFAQLDGRLDGVAARFEGVAGRMDGLEDKLENIHRRLDELGGHLDKQDDKLDAMPTSVGGPVRERIDTLESGLKERVERLDSDTKERIGSTTDTLRSALTETAEMVDSSERLDNLGERLERVTNRLDELAGRLDKVEEGFTAQLGDLDGSVKSGLAKVEGTLSKQPDNDYFSSVVRKSNEESERRIGGQLDEAMATFAELMLGGGPAPQTVAVAPPAPRQPRRRNGRAQKGADSKAKANGSDADSDD
ncbi:PA containing protein [Prauserella sp. PE36]|uniref:PA containing protein n=1 Tax=Prauserella endophytica TaxID=1592324 RepID=A0ABY2RUS4_9PSEU|nr:MULTISPECIES: PA containing protein [Prauserella]PXY17283.1 PA containing protein [Prauserella coralliicola]RBM11385.1 PA containing protein [Prauserella sp. PE36]TKG59483.1 PA containing protein [Prauserella endophytica]